MHRYSVILFKDKVRRKIIKKFISLKKADEFFIKEYEKFEDKELINEIHNYNEKKLQELMGKSISYKNFLTMIKIAYNRVKLN